MRHWRILDEKKADKYHIHIIDDAGTILGVDIRKIPIGFSIPQWIMCITTMGIAICEGTDAVKEVKDEG